MGAPLIHCILFVFRLQKMGALEVTRVVDRHQGWLLITCMWLHGGVFHLLANMLSLLVIGIRLEREFGFGMCFHHLWSHLPVVSLQIKSLLSFIYLKFESGCYTSSRGLEGVCYLHSSSNQTSQLVLRVRFLGYWVQCSPSSSQIGQSMLAKYYW